MKKLLYLLIFIPYSFILFSTETSAKSFSDIPEDYVYYDEINYLTDLGIINGFPDGTFRPKEFITNRQAAVMIVRALQWQDVEYNDASERFIDVYKNDSAYKEISIATTYKLFRVEYGITVDLTGTYPTISGWRFFPNNYITREKMAYTLASSFLLKGREDYLFPDVESSLNKPEISILVDNQITTGYEDGTFKPNHYVTREHFAVFLYRTLKNINEKHENLLHKLSPWEVITPIPDYIKAYHYDDDVAPGSIIGFYWDDGRYALIISGDEVRILDSHTLKSTANIGRATAGVDIKESIAAWAQDNYLIISDMEQKKPFKAVEVPNPISSIHFSDDGKYIFLTQHNGIELYPFLIYDTASEEFTEVPYYQVSDVQFKNGEFYFSALSDFHRENHSNNGFTLTNTTYGIYAYNPNTNKTRTIYEIESIVPPSHISYLDNQIILLHKDFYHSGIYTIDYITNKVSKVNDTDLYHIFNNSADYVFLKDTLYYIENGYLKSYHLKTKEHNSILQLQLANNNNEIYLDINSGLLFIYGPSIPTTIMRVQ